MNVPFVDLSRTNDPLLEQFGATLSDVVSRENLILGEPVQDFERLFADYVGARQAIGVGSGADALEIILRSCNIGVGDEVIVPANSFIATATAVSLAGAKPVFSDVQEDALVSAENIAKVASKRTKAIIAVHLYGQCCNMTDINAWAHANHIKVIEDACQAHGASWNDAMAGSLGCAAAFSFYPTKNLGALGDGGAVTTSDPQIAANARLWRNYGSTKKYHHALCGKNSRLDTLQASFLRLKLAHFEEALGSRRQAAKWLIDGLSDLPLRTMSPNVLMRHSCHLFVIFVESRVVRDALLNHLHQCEISSMIHYPVAIHLQPAYRQNNAQDLPVAERLCATAVSLPIFPGITAAEIGYVIDKVTSFYKGRYNF